MPTPTVEPSSGVKNPTKVSLGTTVVKVECLSDSRPAESLATASTVYWVEVSRWSVGVQPRPSALIVPGHRGALGVLDDHRGELAARRGRP